MMTLAFTVLLLAASVHSASRCDISAIKDCDEIYTNVSKVSGLFTIYPTVAPVQVYCDMSTDGGRWTVIQRRVDGTVNFYRPWEQYKAGFGNADGEYWLGLEAMHLLTLKRKHELRVDMEDFEGNRVFAKYSSFSVGSEAHGYKLLVTGFMDGGAGDALTYNNGQKFSTFDRDQDKHSKNCAVVLYGAFWYNECHSANVNGVYLWGKTDHYGTGVVWFQWMDHKYSLKAVSMKIRPVS